MQHTQRKLSTILAAVAILGTALTLAARPSQAAGTMMEFGINIGGIDEQAHEGIKPNYAVLWAGPWTIDNWGYFDNSLATLAARGVTPVVQFYYWGNDLNTNCWHNGCQSGVHGFWKDQPGWTKLAQQLAQHLNSKLAGKKAVIIVETEFNKGDMGASETLDAGLAAKATFLQDNYAGAVVAMGFGNWAYHNWHVFDRAMAASDEAGLQGMRGSTRDTVASYTGVVGALIKGSQELKNRFGKPVFIHDIAVSTYPEPEWLKHQATVVSDLFRRMGELKAAGVHALVYRALKDNPSATTAEYYGEGERHFGLKWAGNGTAKPAYAPWRNGILAERQGTAPTPTPTTSASSFAATFTIKAPGEWWQEVYIQPQGGVTVSAVHLRRDGGPWQTMTKSDWGAWTSWYNTRPGTQVEFRATATSGALSQSQPFTWMDGQITTSSTTSSTTTGPTPTSSAAPVTTTTAAPVAVAWSKEAEAFPTRTTGGLAGHGQASGGKYWNLWSNGYVAAPVDLPATGTYEIRVRAMGQLMDNIKPHMEVRLGGALAFAADPGPNVWGDYVGTITVTSTGTKEVRIVFTNNASTSTEDRNLWVDRVEVRKL